MCIIPHTQGFSQRNGKSFRIGSHSDTKKVYINLSLEILCSQIMANKKMIKILKIQIVKKIDVLMASHNY